MQYIQMQFLDTYNKNHLEFTYDTLRERFQKKNIEIESESQQKQLPSFNEHVKKLRKKNYLAFYIITYRKMPFAEIYISKNLELAVFLNTKHLKLIKNKFKKIIRDKNNVMLYDIFYKILRKHKKQVPYLIAKIHPENILSQKGAFNLGFKNYYNCYILKNN